jgi:exonuclease SbcD
MKILHTSDWHIGRLLYSQKRYAEFQAFLNWLVDQLIDQNIELLIVAGDIFDTTTPSNKAQSLYYQFLSKVSQTACRHIVVIGGNHDSASFLNAPREILSALNVSVVGAATDNIEDEILLLRDESKRVEAIVVAVPYLRERDIQQVGVLNKQADKQTKVFNGIKDHYQKVCELAEKKRLQESNHKLIPVVATGHLFAAGSGLSESAELQADLTGEGVRDLYVGNLAYVGADTFPNTIDYVALGHLHVPQKVAGFDHIRYCGSPLPMGFGEAHQQKIVQIVDFKNNKTPLVSEIIIPCFQVLKRIKGDFSEISEQIEILKTEKSDAWLEITYTGDEIITDLRKQLLLKLENSDLILLLVKNNKVYSHTLNAAVDLETLASLSEEGVFQRCLDQNEITKDEQIQLMSVYREVLVGLNDEAEECATKSNPKRVKED